MLVFGHISAKLYCESHWLLWLLGPATIALRPVYDNLRYQTSLDVAHRGVVTATVVAVTSSVWLARLFTRYRMRFSVVWRYVPLPRHLPRRRTPASSRSAALFVVVTGVVWHGGRRRAILASLIREGMAKGQDSARRHMGQARRVLANLPQEGVVASLVNDAVRRSEMVLAAPLVARVIPDFPPTHRAGGNGKTRPC
ncbi:LrgB family protein [Salmonella enterica subsp. enterica]|nr:LrgB family protein [Salmonella enterica subsp. enterica]